MIAPRRKPSLPGMATALLLPLMAAAGCAGDGGAPEPPPPPGFSADTFTRKGLISGATATEAGCRALPDGFWVSTRSGRHECLRFGMAGTDRPARTAVVFIVADPGGAAYRFAGGRAYVERVSEHYELSPETRRAAAEVLSAAMGGLPFIMTTRPGMHGSSGDHGQDRHTEAEVELMDDALTQLRRRYGFQDLVLYGWSSGGNIVANLLARRNDIRCAVIGAAPLDLAQYYRQDDRRALDYYTIRGAELADPLHSVGRIRSNATIYVFGDRRDRNVPAFAWEAWVAAARRAGLNVHTAEIEGLDRPELGGNVKSRHHVSSYGMEVAYACAAGLPEEDVVRALSAGQPIIVPRVILPRGRRLRGAEIEAAFAGRRLHGNEWYPRVNVLSQWGADGALTYLDPRSGTRPVAELRWFVEGDRLCTSRHGCGEVYEDGRFLHLVGGDPAQLRVTFVTAMPGG